jgi:hypothetical protein
MIISVSRRTDIPAFYSEWFMNRVRAGFCLVPNPFNPSQISQVSLKPEDVDVIVFWTRNPRPLFPHLSELEDAGYQYYFLFTLMANPREIDPSSPSVDMAIDAFQGLSLRIGPDRVIWRYDPIFLTSITDFGFHHKTYRHIAGALKGYTKRSIISVAHIYRKIQRRLRELEEQGVGLLEQNDLAGLMGSLAETADQNGMARPSCADELNLPAIEPGKCVDDELISKVFELNQEPKKDCCQRKQCGYVESKDIGMYESCPCGCDYCYATTSIDRASVNYRMHDLHSPSHITYPQKQTDPIAENLNDSKGSIW